MTAGIMTSKQYCSIMGTFPKFNNRFDYNVKMACCLAGFKLSDSFHHASNDKILKNWNGVGGGSNSPSTKLINKLIPKQVVFLNMELASCPHDYDYEFGGTELDRQRADKNFLKNILRWIDIHTNNRLLRRLRRISAYKYYLFVREFGGIYFNYH